MMKKVTVISLSLAIAVICAAVSGAGAESLPKVLGTIDVPGTSNPWLAGMPDGTTAHRDDIAPDQSPVLVTGLFSTLGSWVEFSDVNGLVRRGDAYPFTGPEGNLAVIIGRGPEHGKSALTAPINALIGVFLDASVPSGAEPVALDFTTEASRNYLELYPSLRQPFWIGDGATSEGTHQKIFLPAGTTRLFLGTMDGSDWYNNAGAFSVVVTQVPEPATLALLGLCGLGLLRRRK